MKVKKIKKEWKNIIFNLGFVALNMIFVILFYKNITLTTLLLLIIAIIGIIKWKSKITIMMFLFGGVVGAFLEMIAINYGVWAYSFVNIVNIPLWLIICWGNAAMFIYQMAIEFERLGFHK